MNPFDLDPVANRREGSTLFETPFQPGKLPAEWYEGVGSALWTGVQMPFAREKYSLGVQLNDETVKKNALQKMKELTPDPVTVGSAGQIVHGILDQFGLLTMKGLENPMVSVGAPNIPITEAARTYNESQKALHMREGMDEKTAASVAGTETIGFGLGAVMPAAVPGKLAMRAASGAGINFVQGRVTNSAIFNTLNEAGYHNMAEQYRPFDGVSMATDLAIGALFGGLLGPRPRINNGLGGAGGGAGGTPGETPPITGMPMTATQITDFAQQRLSELEGKANGTPDMTMPGPDGQMVTLPGRVKELLTPEEKTELALLRQHAADPNALTRIYDVRIVDVAPSDLDGALTQNNAGHLELGTAPGIPTDAEGRAAHFNAINEAIQALMAGDQVKVDPLITRVDMLENPSATATRMGVLGAVEEHLGPEWQQLKSELEARNLPGDTTLYQITSDMAPVRPTAEVRGIVDKARAEGWDADRILAELENLKGKLEDRNAARSDANGDKVRGELWVRERLTRAERNGEISPEARRLAGWLLDKNPSLAGDLALSFRKAGGSDHGGQAGGYDPINRIITIIKGRANDETAAHEILHHSERMMPEDVQAGIQAAWRKEIKAVRDWATRTQNETMMRAVSDAIKSALGDEQAFARLAEMIANGEVDQRFYALANPSEFWAVNGSRILRERAAEGWVAKAKQWLKEFIEKVKDAFGLRSDAAVIRGLDSILNSDGQFVSGDMLAGRRIAALQVIGDNLNEGNKDGRPEQAGDGRGRYSSRGLAPLEGAPAVRGFHGPDPRLVSVAERYAAANGIPLRRQAEYVKVDPERASRIAAAYEAMPHDPQNPVVREAYENLVQQTTAQYKALEEAGYKFWFIDINKPENLDYVSTPWNAMRDIRESQTMGVFPTAEGFGTSQDFSPDANPLLADTGLKWPLGGPDGPLVPVLANDLFRAVHDAFGHGLEGAGFRAQGEENAWQAHVRLFTGSAVAAITTETRGQNSWLNYGQHGEANRTASAEDTVFADQKTGLMPEWTWQEGLAPNMPEPRVRLRPGVEAPGLGVANENLNGFEPGLRVRVPIGNLKLPEKPLVLTGTNIKNAEKQVAAIDKILAKFPNADKSPLEWSKMMAYAMATNDVPIPPYRFLADINSDGAFRSLSRLSQGQIDDANHGFENARAFREAYLDGTMGVEDTGKMFLWSFLSRGVSPYTQEGLFIDAFPGSGEWIKKAAEGNFTEKDFDAYEAWAKSVAPKGSGQPGSGATHNLNAFGKLFLFKMGAKGEDGVSLLQHMHNMMTDPNMTGKELRRWFIQNTEGVGIDNKVVSFTMLVAGFDDVMVLDRVQIRQLWDDGRFAGRNLYDGRKVDGKPVAGSMLSEITYGARGLLIYEAIERALSKRIENLYTSLGRPQDASIGRYHWETWVADSQQEASHGTLDAILADAKGDATAISGTTAKEGEYGGYAYGARYGRDAQGQPYFLYSTPLGNEYRFSVEGFRGFMEAVKSPSNKVVPTKFKVTEAGNAPWYEKAEVNKPALDALAKRYAAGAGAEGAGRGAVQETGPGQAVSDLAGRGADPYSAESTVIQRPDLTVPVNGQEVPAARALADADVEIAKAQQDSQGYDAAVACALRG